VFAYLPSPSSNGFHIGGLRLRAYGLLIALGVFAAVWLADRRWRARGGEAGTISALALWAVPGGLIGARIYHIATDYELYTHHWANIFKIWQGGLGIWGGIAGGVAGGYIYLRRHRIPLPVMMDVVAPALPLAQAIGRWGNYFNQELFGRPSKLPWAVKIDLAHRPAAYIQSSTFHPTFLYESIWDLIVVALLLFVIEKRVKLRQGFLFAAYVALYTFGRFFTEYLRIDFAHKILGLRLNDWVSIIIFAAAALLIVTRGLAPEPEPAPAGAAAEAEADPEAGTEAEAGSAEEPATVPAGPPTTTADTSATAGTSEAAEPPAPAAPPPAPAAPPTESTAAPPTAETPPTHEEAGGTAPGPE
jgi:prolipoprotein diacylglyceryl transferase